MLHLILLHTVYHPDELTKYEPYLESNQDGIINSFECYDELQTQFYNAWMASSADNATPMDAFWQKAQTVKEQAPSFGRAPVKPECKLIEKAVHEFIKQRPRSNGCLPFALSA